MLKTEILLSLKYLINFAIFKYNSSSTCDILVQKQYDICISIYYMINFLCHSLIRASYTLYGCQTIYIVYGGSFLFCLLIADFIISIYR